MIDRVTFEQEAGVPGIAGDYTPAAQAAVAWQVADDVATFMVRWAGAVTEAFTPAVAWLSEWQALYPKPPHRAYQWRRPASAFRRQRAGMVRR